MKRVLDSFQELRILMLIISRSMEKYKRSLEESEGWENEEIHS